MCSGAVVQWCCGALSDLPVAMGAEACRRADRSARCAVVQRLTCLSPWVQKPAGEQTGARGMQWCSGAVSDLPVAMGAEACRRADRSARCAVVQWCSVSLACRLGCRSLPESRQEREVCSGAVVQCPTCLSPWVQKPAGEQTGARGVQWCSV